MAPILCFMGSLRNLKTLHELEAAIAEEGSRQVAETSSAFNGVRDAITTLPVGCRAPVGIR